MDEDNLVPSTTLQIAHDEQVTDLAEEYAQITLDAIRSNDILGHIPVIKTVVAGVRAVGAVRDAIFARKLLAFLMGMASISKWEREDMVSRLEKDTAYRRRVATHLVELLDRIDSHRKPAMIAAVFTAFAKQEIDAATLNRLLAAIESLPSFEVETVRRFNNASPEERSDISVESLQALANAGLAAPQSAWGGLVYQPNQTCSVFVSLNLDIKSG